MIFLATAAVLMLAPQSLTASLQRDPARMAEWEALVHHTPAKERPALVYVLENMPLPDLKGLATSYVAESIKIAYTARNATTWGKDVPQAIFFDDVAPYAAITEPRESMRLEFQKKYLPMVLKTKTPAEAAMVINENVFKDYHVKYDTNRLRTDQSAPETVSQGMATCTGLSIMLVEALRAVGVPCRVAGINTWPGTGGNHTWVEVWSGGSWHFVGAAEPDPAGLDHAWFADKAATAVANNPEEAIYAVTFKRGTDQWPLAWDPGDFAPAVNVTDRYKKKVVETPADQLMVDVTNGGRRVAADVHICSVATGKEVYSGTSMGPHVDINRHIDLKAQPGEQFLITAAHDGQTALALAEVKGNTLVKVNLDEPNTAALNTLLAQRFGTDALKATVAGELLDKVAFTPAEGKLAWKELLATPDSTLQAEFNANTVSTPDRTSPYLWRTVGTEPAGGWGLVIAMHGGGNAPKAENDSEWHYMFSTYYKDHREAGGYIYLALRAPNDTWNGFYDDAISPLIERLIWQFVKYKGVNPNKVYACGASHGGYGAFVIGPKIPYRFAAVHAAAAAPTDGETQGENLRDLPFTWAVGEHDTDYGRLPRAQAFAKQWSEWQKQYGGFQGSLHVVPGDGHLINEYEADEIPRMMVSTRNPQPKHVIWVQSDDVLHHFYWLEAEKPVNGGRIEAVIAGNTVTMTTLKQGAITLWLSPADVDVTKPLVVVRDAVRKEYTLSPNLGDYCARLAALNDPNLAAPIKVVVPAE